MTGESEDLDLHQRLALVREVLQHRLQVDRARKARSFAGSSGYPSPVAVDSSSRNQYLGPTSNRYIASPHNQVQRTVGLTEGESTFTTSPATTHPLKHPSSLRSNRRLDKEMDSENPARLLGLLQQARIATTSVQKRKQNHYSLAGFHMKSAASSAAQSPEPVRHRVGRNSDSLWSSPISSTSWSLAPGLSTLPRKGAASGSDDDVARSPEAREASPPTLGGVIDSPTRAHIQQRLLVMSDPRGACLETERLHSPAVQGDSSGAKVDLIQRFQSLAEDATDASNVSGHPSSSHGRSQPLDQCQQAQGGAVAVGASPSHHAAQQMSEPSEDLRGALLPDQLMQAVQLLEESDHGRYTPLEAELALLLKHLMQCLRHVTQHAPGGAVGEQALVVVPLAALESLKADRADLEREHRALVSKYLKLEEAADAGKVPSLGGRDAYLQQEVRRLEEELDASQAAQAKLRNQVSVLELAARLSKHAIETSNYAESHSRELAGLAEHDRRAPAQSAADQRIRQLEQQLGEMERQLARRNLELASVAGAVGHQDALSTPDTAGPHRRRPAPGEASARSVQDLKSEMRDQRNALDLTLKEHEASSQKLLSAAQATAAHQINAAHERESLLAQLAEQRVQIETHERWEADTLALMEAERSSALVRVARAEATAEQARGEGKRQVQRDADTLQALEQEVAAASRARSDAEKQIQRITELHHSETNRIRLETRQEVERSLESAAALRQQRAVASVKSEAEATALKLQAAEAEIRWMREAMETTPVGLQDARRAEGLAAEERARTERAARLLEDEKRALTQQVRKAQAQVTSLLEQKQSCKLELEQRNSDAASLSERLTEATNRSAALKRKNLQLALARDAAIHEKQQKECAAELLASEQETVVEELLRARAQARELADERDAAVEQRQLATARASKLSEERQSSFDKWTRSEAELQALEEQCEEALAQRSHVQVLLEQLAADHKATSAELHQSRSALRRLTADGASDADRLHSELKAIQRDAARLEKDKSGLEDEVAALKAQIAQVAQSEAALTEQRQHHLQEFAEVQEQARRWEDEVVSLTAQLASSKESARQLAKERDAAAAAEARALEGTKQLEQDRDAVIQRMKEAVDAHAADKESVVTQLDEAVVQLEGAQHQVRQLTQTCASREAELLAWGEERDQALLQLQATAPKEEFDQLEAEREAVARALVDQEAQLQALLQEHANTTETLNRTLQEVDQHRAETHAHENRMQQARDRLEKTEAELARALEQCHQHQSRCLQLEAEQNAAQEAQNNADKELDQSREMLSRAAAEVEEMRIRLSDALSERDGAQAKLQEEASQHSLLIERHVAEARKELEIRLAVAEEARSKELQQQQQLHKEMLEQETAARERERAAHDQLNHELAAAQSQTTSLTMRLEAQQSGWEAKCEVLERRLATEAGEAARNTAAFDVLKLELSEELASAKRRLSAIEQESTHAVSTLEAERDRLQCQLDQSTATLHAERRKHEEERDHQARLLCSARDEAQETLEGLDAQRASESAATLLEKERMLAEISALEDAQAVATQQAQLERQRAIDSAAETHRSEVARLHQQLGEVRSSMEAAMHQRAQLHSEALAQQESASLAQLASETARVERLAQLQDAAQSKQAEAEAEVRRMEHEQAEALVVLQQKEQHARALLTEQHALQLQTLEAEQADQLRRVQDERTTLRDTVARMQSAAEAAQKQAQAELDELRESMHAAASEAVTQQALLHLQLDEQSASTSQLAISLAAAEAEREEQDNQLQLVVHQSAQKVRRVQDEAEQQHACTAQRAGEAEMEARTLRRELHDAHSQAQIDLAQAEQDKAELKLSLENLEAAASQLALENGELAGMTQQAQRAQEETDRLRVELQAAKDQATIESEKNQELLQLVQLVQKDALAQQQKSQKEHEAIKDQLNSKMSLLQAVCDQASHQSQETFLAVGRDADDRTHNALASSSASPAQCDQRDGAVATLEAQCRTLKQQLLEAQIQLQRQTAESEEQGLVVIQHEQDNRRRDASLATLTREVQTAKQHMEELERRASAKERLMMQEKAAMQVQFDQKQEHSLKLLVAAQSTLSDVRTMLNEKEAVIVATREEVAAAEQSLASEKQVIAQLQSQLLQASDLGAAIKSVTSTNAAALEQFAAGDALTSRLRSQLEASQAQVGHLRGEMQALGDESASEVMRLRDQLRVATEARSAAAESAEAAAAKWRASEMALSVASDQSVLAAGELQSLQARLAVLASDSKSATEARKEVAGQLAREVEERRALEQELAAARESSVQLAAAQDSLHEAKAELAQVQAQLERAQEELQTATQRADRLQEKLDADEAANERQLSTLQEDYSVALERLVSERAELVEQATTAQSWIECAAAQAHTTQSQQLSRIETLEETCRALQERLAAVQTEASHQELEVVRAKNAEVETVVHQRDVALSELAHERQVISEMVQTVSTLQAEVEAKDLELEARCNQLQVAYGQLAQSDHTQLQELETLQARAVDAENQLNVALEAASQWRARAEAITTPPVTKTTQRQGHVSSDALEARLKAAEEAHLVQKEMGKVAADERHDLVEQLQAAMVERAALRSSQKSQELLMEALDTVAEEETDRKLRESARAHTRDMSVDLSPDTVDYVKFQWQMDRHDGNRSSTQQPKTLSFT